MEKQNRPRFPSSINDGKEYVVESGLNTGDVIIAEGAGLLRDGITVEEGGQQ